MAGGLIGADAGRDRIVCRLGEVLAPRTFHLPVLTLPPVARSSGRRPTESCAHDQVLHPRPDHHRRPGSGCFGPQRPSIPYAFSHEVVHKTLWQEGDTRRNPSGFSSSLSLAARNPSGFSRSGGPPDTRRSSHHEDPLPHGPLPEDVAVYPDGNILENSAGRCRCGGSYEPGRITDLYRSGLRPARPHGVFGELGVDPPAGGTGPEPLWGSAPATGSVAGFGQSLPGGAVFGLTKRSINMIIRTTIG